MRRQLLYGSVVGMTLVAGCGDKETDTSSVDPSSPSQSENPCAQEDETGYEVLFSGGAYVDNLWNETSLIIQDQEAWDSFVDMLSFVQQSDSLPRDTFDWSTEQVVVASAFESSTCGLSVTVATSCIIDSQPTVYLEVEDSSGGCQSVCDAEGQVIYVVVLPAEVTPNVLVNMTSACDQFN